MGISRKCGLILKKKDIPHMGEEVGGGTGNFWKKSRDYNMHFKWLA